MTGSSARAPRLTYDLALAEADYPQWEGRPHRTLVICTHQRSGSSLLGEAITFAGDMGTPLEYFHRGFRPSFEQRWGSSDTTAYVADLYRYRTDPGGTLAVKLFWQDVADIAAERDPTLEQLRAIAPGDVPPGLYRRAREILDGVLPNAVWVSLERRDTIRQAVSLQRARQTDVWRDLNRRDISSMPEPQYDFAGLADQLHWIARARARWNGFFAANEIAPHIITYERMVRDFETCFRDLRALMGLSTITPPPTRMRRQADALSETWSRRLLVDLRCHTGTPGENPAPAPTQAT